MGVNVVSRGCESAAWQEALKSLSPARDCFGTGAPRNDNEGRPRDDRKDGSLSPDSSGRGNLASLARGCVGAWLAATIGLIMVEAWYQIWYNIGHEMTEEEVTFQWPHAS